MALHQSLTGCVVGEFYTSRLLTEDELRFTVELRRFRPVVLMVRYVTLLFLAPFGRENWFYQRGKSFDF